MKNDHDQGSTESSGDNADVIQPTANEPNLPTRANGNRIDRHDVEGDGRSDLPSNGAAIPPVIGPAVDGRLMAVEYHRSGPLPDPSELAGYENVLAGAAKRIFEMAEANNAAAIKRYHEREELIRADHEREHAIKERGQIFAFIILLSVIVASCICILTNHTGLGALFGATGIGFMVSNAVQRYIPNTDRKENTSS